MPEATVNPPEIQRHQDEVTKLRAEITRLEAELAKVYEIGRLEMAILRGKLVQLFHGLGFNHVDAKAKTTEVFGPEA